MAVVLTNNAVSRLASSLTTGATAISVASGEGARFPSPGAGDWFPLTLVKATGALEIVRCTARAGDVLTVTRSQEGTAAQAFSSGDRVELRLTAAALNTIFGGGSSIPTFGGIELTGVNPFIDFHFGSSAADFTGRIKAESSSSISVSSASKTQLTISDDGLTTAGFVAANQLYSNNGRLTLRLGLQVTEFSEYGDVRSSTDGGVTFGAWSRPWTAATFNPENYVLRDAIDYVGFYGGDVSAPYFRRKSDSAYFYLQPRLGFVPVRQGGGGGQDLQTVFIGGSGLGPRIQTDGTDYGRIWTDSNAASIYGGLGAGSVGTYAFLRNASGASVGAGGVIAGSLLLYADSSAGSSGGPTGTWRCMGWGYSGNATVWLRVS